MVYIVANILVNECYIQKWSLQFFNMQADVIFSRLLVKPFSDCFIPQVLLPIKNFTFTPAEGKN